MEQFNAFIQQLVDFITNLALVFNRIPWDTIINGLISKILNS